MTKIYTNELMNKFNYDGIYEPLIKNLYGFMDMPEGFEALLIPHLGMPVYYKEDTPVLAVGETAKMAYWPLEGYTRCYVKVQPDADREFFKQATLDVSLPDQVTLASYSFMNQMPSVYNMEITKGSTMISFSHQAFVEMSRVMPEVRELALKIVSGTEIDWLKKLDMCKVTCKEGYARFLDHFGLQVEEHMDLQHIASYLGITPQHLSNLRG